MRIYLDNCCLNRPFDDQSHVGIRLESEAKLCIQEQIRTGRLEIVWSYMLDFENAANPFEERQSAIRDWKSLAVADIVETPALLQTARRMLATGLKPKDALHLACAIAAACDYFVTTDHGILKRVRDVPNIVIASPITLVQELNL